MNIDTVPVFATVVSAESFPYCLTMQHSLYTNISSSCVLYVLCTTEEIYRRLEEMEYNNIYMIALSELEERDLYLCEQKAFMTQKKYLSILHIALVEYILFNNPLVSHVQYINPYVYCLDEIAIGNISTLPIAVFGHTEDSGREVVSPYYIDIKNSDDGKLAWKLYRELYTQSAMDTSAVYTEYFADENLCNYVDKYPHLVYIEKSKEIAFTHPAQHIMKRTFGLVGQEGCIVCAYMKDILFYKGGGYSTYFKGEFIEQYYSMIFIIKPYYKALQRMFYKCRLYKLPVYIKYGTFQKYLYNFLESRRSSFYLI